MKTWHLIAPRELKEFEQNEAPLKAGEARIKIFNVLLNSFDAMVYDGTMDAAYPLIPGRFAVGKVVALDESDTPDAEKGSRVFLNPVFPDSNFKGDSTPLLGMESTKFAGQTCDGFLAPYVTVRPENLCVLPESVSNETALYTYLIALAESALDKIGEIKGKYIAVVGATALGIILCQLLVYYQAVPVLIDSRTTRLEFARQCGVTYAFLNDENLDANINDITGAAFADGAVYVASGNAVVNTVAFRVTAPEKTVVFCGFAPQNLQVNLEMALKKQLHIIGVSDASENISSAINLLANKAVDVNRFAHSVYPLEELPKAYEAGAADRGTDHNIRLTVIDCYGKL